MDAIRSSEGTSVIDRVCRASVALTGVSTAQVIVMSDDPAAGVGLVLDQWRGSDDDWQFDLGEGPSIDAHRDAHVVLVPDLASVHDWPAFGEAAEQAGVHAVFAFPMRAGGARVGVLTLSRTTPGPLSVEALADARGLAELALEAVLDLQAEAGPDEVLDRLTDSGASEWVVHQAAGVVAVQLSVTVREALVRVRAHAFAAELALPVVAAAIVAGELRLDSDHG